MPESAGRPQTCAYENAVLAARLRSAGLEIRGWRGARGAWMDCRQVRCAGRGCWDGMRRSSGAALEARGNR